MGTHAQTESKMNTTNSDSPREIQIKICVCWYTHATVHVKESVLSSCYVGTGDQIQVVRLEDKCLCPLNNLYRLPYYIFENEKHLGLFAVPSENT